MKRVVRREVVGVALVLGRRLWAPSGAAGARHGGTYVDTSCSCDLSLLVNKVMLIPFTVCSFFMVAKHHVLLS